METSRLMASPVRTGNLVLKVRLALVIRNLQHVQRALATVKQRRAYLRQVLMFPERAAASIDRLGAGLNRASDAYDNGSWKEMSSALSTLNFELEALKDQVTALEDPVNELRSAATLEEAEVAKSDTVTNAIHQLLKNAVSAEFGDRLERLQALWNVVGVAGGEGEAESAEEMQAAWSQYIDSFHKSSEQLFEEYVDLVSGVAIRDTGLDRGISRLAEDMLKPGETIGSFTWNTLTVPAREEALAVTAARIVRLGFPEWTIWTLPLTAYELGSDYADSDRKVAEKVVHALGGDPGELFVLVADAFATYFLGPAYACAEILMRLNPAEAFSGSRLIAKRAAVILSVLRQMSKNAPGIEDHYAEITSRLAVEWADALRQTGWDGSVDGDAAEAWPGLRQLTGLMDEEQETIDRLLRAFEPLVYAWIVSDIAVWPNVEEWAAKLKNGQELLASDLGGLAELRYVLNAAWRARIAVRPGETDVDDPRQLAEIAQVVERLLWSLVRQSKGAAPTSEAGQRPPLQYPRWRDRGGRRAQPGKETS
jgi:hypothetical protein